MKKVLFICHGNICRSPMGEFILKDLAAKAGLLDRLFVASAAVSREEVGNPVYPPARRVLAAHGISCEEKTAVQVCAAGYNRYDYILYMEQANLPRLLRLVGPDRAGKCHRLLDFTSCPGDIDDPWYTGDFSGVYNQIQAGCAAFLQYLEDRHEL